MKHVITDAGRKDTAPNEQRDCTVRAVAIACGIEYREALTLLASVGRKAKRGVVFKKVAAKLGFEICPEFSCMTLRKAIAIMPTGPHIVRIHRHVFAMIDGVIFDRTSDYTGNERVKMVYRKAT